MTSSLTDRIDALEALVSRQADHLAIIQLIASYGPTADSTVDEDATQRLVGLWAEDGSYDITGYGVFSGREVMAPIFRQEHYDLVAGGIGHLMGLPYVVVDGDRATALNHSVVFYKAEDGFFAKRVGMNKWLLSKTAGHWQITSRVNRLLDGSDDGIALAGEISALSKGKIQ
jgi:hypothetical protein